MSSFINDATMAVNPGVIRSRLGQRCVYIITEAVRHSSQDLKHQFQTWSNIRLTPNGLFQFLNVSCAAGARECRA